MGVLIGPQSELHSLTCVGSGGNQHQHETVCAAEPGGSEPRRAAALLLHQHQLGAELGGVGGAEQGTNTPPRLVARQVVVAWNAGSAVGFSMLKQLEVEMYEMNAALADTSGELKELMRKMFETLNEELKKASPALREIIDGGRLLWN